MTTFNQGNSNAELEVTVQRNMQPVKWTKRKKTYRESQTVTDTGLYRRLHGTSHQAELVSEDAKHIRGALWELENRFQLPFTHRTQDDASTGVDTEGLVPWHPNGAPFELTVAEVWPMKNV